MGVTQHIDLINPILGMQPYVLIEADIDPADGELVLEVSAGGGAGEDVGALPFMLFTTLPAEQNQITTAIRDTLAEHPEDREAFARLAAYMGVPMPEDS